MPKVYSVKASMRKFVTCMLLLSIGLTVAAQVVERTTDETSKVYSLDEKTSELSVAPLFDVTEQTCLSAIPAIQDQAPDVEAEGILERQTFSNPRWSYKDKYNYNYQIEDKEPPAGTRSHNHKLLPAIRRL
jgi:hypothetical protein